MIRFNRAITPVKVLSFDLDDTLYNNHPIIKAAVQAQIDYLNALPDWQAQGRHYWQHCRELAVKRSPALVDNVTQWRKDTLQLGLAKLGYQGAQLEQHVSGAYHAFADARSNIVVSDEVLSLLAQLAKKYQLIAITNGNVEVERFNLNGVFDLVLQAGLHGKAKPHPTMFDQACEQLNIEPKHILHIGDSLDTDVHGAHNAGCQSLWLNDQQARYAYRGLPDVEIASIHALKYFL
ncbi:HAD-IA family hydrolase [Pseudoalteromonas sp. H105]|uniref:HAD-IA family hydrolase n=1 Tax=Pseudoalteromonas sp. H105 TaxID=1348393 RepID=UPI00073206BF|nr:HAD-IA family hydrolase [Pseudoalteromonas sp. H105]KTF13793.1 haloacid dehalogenase [Pseudoalteromonas sp. H105]